mgnify:CR=1 FL=1
MFNFLPPAIICYTDNLPANVAGRARWFLVEIRKGYETDKGILMHELFHVKVWWLTFGPLGILVRNIDSFRLWNEAAAYKVQTQHPNKNGGYMTVDEAAVRLAGPHYGFGITFAQAKQRILKA